MQFWYTARGPFTNKDGDNWEKYIEFSKLYQLSEVVSLDSMLNELVVQPDLTNALDWEYIVTDGEYFTGLFKKLPYVLKKTNLQMPFNLLAVVKEPFEPCESLLIADYEFIGYDLLDKSYDISALVNCGGFENTFDNVELNKFGLIESFARAMQVNKLLLENNPEEYHADCNRFAVWRHTSLGRS